MKVAQQNQCNEKAPYNKFMKLNFHKKYKLRASTKNSEYHSQKNNKKRIRTQFLQQKYSNGNQHANNGYIQKKRCATEHNQKNINQFGHGSDTCLCSKCQCGRHLCSFQSAKLSINTNSNYKREYKKKKPIQNKINISKEYECLKGPNLSMNSVYNSQFASPKRQKAYQKSKPEDNLKCEGPLMSITSYSSEFPGHRGNNQYVKPSNKYTRGQFCMRYSTTYSSSFTRTILNNKVSGRIPDNLKSGKSWMGQSTYAKTFVIPNPEYFAEIHKVQQKLDEVIPYSKNLAKTNYNLSYHKHSNVQCPANIIIRNRINKIQGYKSKGNFKQNTNFKNLDDSFRPLSAVK